MRYYKKSEYQRSEADMLLAGILLFGVILFLLAPKPTPEKSDEIRRRYYEDT